MRKLLVLALGALLSGAAFAVPVQVLVRDVDVLPRGGLLCGSPVLARICLRWTDTRGALRFTLDDGESRSFQVGRLLVADERDLSPVEAAGTLRLDTRIRTVAFGVLGASTLGEATPGAWNDAALDLAFTFAPISVLLADGRSLVFQMSDVSFSRVRLPVNEFLTVSLNAAPTGPGPGPGPVAPVPEPSSYAMVGLGLFGLAWMKQRSKRRAAAESKG